MLFTYVAKDHNGYFGGTASFGNYTQVSRSTIEGRRGCHKFVPVLGEDGTKIAPSEDLFDQPTGEMS